jgi:hypothetical protein
MPGKDPPIATRYDAVWAPDDVAKKKFFNEMGIEL